MQRTGDLLAPSSIKLPPSHVSVTRLRDLNRTEAVVQCVEFHPSASIVLTAGFHKTLDLIQVWCCVSEQSWFIDAYNVH